MTIGKISKVSLLALAVASGGVTASWAETLKISTFVPPKHAFNVMLEAWGEELAEKSGGELTVEDINALWMSVQAESLGPAFTFMEGYETFWSYVPHFVHSPFYVYAYAFGDGLVNALYAVYEQGEPDFQEKYFDMLKAGGSKHHKELLAPFGLDASDPAFWDKGLGMISSFIDQLEAMEKS